MSPKLQATLDSYFTEVGGPALLAHERAACQRLIDSVFGYCAVESSVVQGGLQLKTSTGNYWWASNSVEVDAGDLYCSPGAWPFINEDVDLAILHHLLDFSGDPHDVFRDTARIVKAGGYLLIVGFNPFSLLSLKQSVKRWNNPAWHFSALAENRLRDWLQLFGFSVVSCQYTQFLPTPKGATFRRVNELLAPLTWRFGSSYVMLAKKQKYSGLMRRSRAEKLMQQFSGGVVNPAASKEISS